MASKWIVSGMTLVWLVGCGPQVVDERTVDSMSYEEYKAFADKADFGDKCYDSWYESRYCYPHCDWGARGIALGCQACQGTKCGDSCTQLDQLGGKEGKCDSLGSCVVPEEFEEGECGPEGSSLEWLFSEPAGIAFTKSEITVAQYRACVEAGECTEPMPNSDSRYCNWGHSGRDDHPINCVDWYQATQFCEWAGGRLPTEDEWYAEASNGGTREYPWGDSEVDCDHAVWGDGEKTDGCGHGSTWPVCSKPKGYSASGLCEMSGNLWEWTSTSEGSARVLRGGSWSLNNPDRLRASPRSRLPPTDWSNDSGFRCGRSAE